MLEWNISEDNAPLPSDSPEPSPRRPLHCSFWLILFLLVVGMVMGVLLMFWWRARVVDQQMREDLLIQIQLEEQARRFGLEEQAEQFMAENAPRVWRGRYQNSFDLPPTDAISTTISLANVIFEENTAQVQVQLGRQVQERRYQLTEAGWRRVPLPSLSPGSFMNRRVGDTVFAYHAAHTPFAETVIAAYPEIIGLWSEWGNALPTITTVGIHNEEFIRPVYVEETTLRLTNPAIATLPAHWNLTGEEAVRFGMAREIGTRLALTRINPVLLPGNARFIEALTTVTALRWAIADEAYSDLMNRWRNIAEAQIGSSFFEHPNESQPIDPYAPTSQEAVALLIADYLYREGGNRQIAEIVQRMSGAEQWDDIFIESVGLITLEVETVARGGTLPADILTTTLIRGTPIPKETGFVYPVFQLQVEGYNAPIWVQANNNTEVFLPDGTPIANECADLFPQVEVEGEWYESGLRLRAERIRITSTELVEESFALPAPANTRFYFDRSETDASGALTHHVIAVGDDGTETTVWSRPSLNFDPMLRNSFHATMPDTGITALGTLLYNCDVQWVLHYTPQDGVVSSWLFTNSIYGLAESSYLWDAQRGIGMATSPNFSQTDRGNLFWILKPDDPSPQLEAEGNLLPGFPRLLRPGQDEVLIRERNGQGAFLYDWVENQTIQTWSTTPDSFLDFMLFDPTGRYLYLATTYQQDDFQDLFARRSLLIRYDFQTGEERELWNEAMGGIQTVGIDATGERLYAVVLLEESEELAVMKYENNLWTPLLTADSDEQFYFYLKMCRTGGAFFLRNDKSIEQNPSFPVFDLLSITPSGDLSPDVIQLDTTRFPLGC